MEPRYDPAGVEERWQRTWEAEGLYNADPDPSRESFANAHPPPNVTGDLHLGHALQLSLADTIVRTKRMQGFNVLFQPGYDHAGISTQNAVEKHLALEGKTRHEDRKSTRLNSSHPSISYAVFCLKKKKKKRRIEDDVTNVTIAVRWNDSYRSL